ncbi:serine/threonine-protein kinase PLK4 isoform X2 [Patella vulgata]|uniref:serine/threonine-protein kinase PLK4 isoform X2 n=1 Tax=Patella vulgata TaxID=6465 RepID=UPI0021809567|nr:serine/threonine-protein kinase PLK4 isoform X2 [Patella vulgata]
MSSLVDYQVLNLLGKGAFACVYRARSNKTGVEVAIKMIDKKLMKAAGMVTRVKKEVEIHSRLKHPSILELYNYFEDSNYVYLVIEMCHNGELQRFLKSNCKVLTEDEARQFMKQIVEGMFYLHSHGILHRDLTLSNLLLSKDNNVKIADFGLATQLTVPDEKHFTMCGTPNYISPEVAMRSAHGLEADVWSLGCMLYTFLVGKPPFDTDAVKSTLNRVILADYEIPVNLSPEAKDLIQCLLRKNPKDRISLKDLVKHPFMTKASIQTSRKISKKSAEMSMDSGQGTMSSRTTSSSSRSKPFPAFPITEISEIEENFQKFTHQVSKNSKGGFRHPPSPPVRLRDSDRESEMLRMKMNHFYGQVMSSDYHTFAENGSKFTNHQFDPSRYTENSQASSSSSWSCGGTSVHSSVNNSKTQPSLNTLSDTNSSHGQINPTKNYLSHSSDLSSEGDSEFSLQNTKRVLSFNSDSKPNSLHDKYKTDSEMCRTQTIEEKFPHLKGLSGSIEFNSTAKSTDSKSVTQNIKSACWDVQSVSEKTVSKGGSIETFVNPVQVERLRPIRQKTKNAVVNILESNEVCLEFFKLKGKEERVVEVFLISSDGQQISIWQPYSGHSIDMSNQFDTDVLLDPPVKTFTYKLLPEKYWKKYQYAARFVDLVRSKTPKVTLYTHRSKCMLMENSPDPDFEAIFYDGAKFTANTKGMKIIETNGTSLSLESTEAELRLSSETQSCLEFVKQCRQQCLELESAITSVQKTGILKDQLFPVIVGRRPNSSDGSESSRTPSTPSDTKNTPTPSEPDASKFNIKSMPMPSFNGTVMSSMSETSSISHNLHNDTISTQASSPDSTSNNNHIKSQVIRQMFVPHVGWAAQHASGEIWVKFNDGSQLSVKSSATTVTYFDIHGKLYKYQKTDLLPETVKSKLEKVPIVLEYLRTKFTHNSHNTRPLK